jgi:hypothetical protein
MKVIMCALRGRGGRSGERDSWHLRLEIGEKDVSNTIDTVQKDYLLMEIYERDCDSGQDRPAPAGQDNINRGYMPGLDRGVTPERGMDESDIGC